MRRLQLPCPLVVAYLGAYSTVHSSARDAKPFRRP
jgi:hypothetical protein